MVGQCPYHFHPYRCQRLATALQVLAVHLCLLQLGHARARPEVELLRQRRLTKNEVGTLYKLAAIRFLLEGCLRG